MKRFIKGILFKRKIYSFMVVLIICGCGGGNPPIELSKGKIEICEWDVSKKLLAENPDLGLIYAIYDMPDTDNIAIVGWEGSCILKLPNRFEKCGKTPEALGILPRVFTKGSFIDDGSIAADFNNDGLLEEVKPLGEEGFVLLGSDKREIARIVLDRDYWYEPAVTFSRPHLLLVSTDGALFIFDGALEEILRLSTPGITAPLHISSAAPLGKIGKSPFVSVFKGRGGWHRAILFIHSPEGMVVYKEILVGDFPVVWPLPQEFKHRVEFILGGRGQLWRYSIELKN